jgi:hypothetical protein
MHATNATRLFTTISVLCFIFFTQCKKETIDTNVDCSGSIPTYSANVKSIMDANCATPGCHSASSRSAGYDLSSYLGTKTSAANNAFLGSVQHKSGFSKMPKGRAKLSDADIKILTCWVQNGTPQ